jgi:hypothetical protein
MPRRYPDYLPQARAALARPARHRSPSRHTRQARLGNETTIVGNEIEADARRAREGRSGRRGVGDTGADRRFPRRAADPRRGGRGAGAGHVAARIPGLTDITAIAGGSETGYAITH